MSVLPRAETHTRWNFVIIVLDASFFMAGWAFLDPTAVLPQLVATLTTSKVLIGLVGTIQRAGWLIPQLLGASFVLHRERKLPFVLYPCLISRLPFYALAALMFTPWAAQHPGALLWLLIAGYAIFCFGDGLTGVPWHDIIARSIPPTLRGRFFGSMQFTSGLLAIGAAQVVGKVLDDPTLPFPSNYGLLFCCLCVGLTLSSLCLALIREPKSVAVDERQSFLALFLSIPSTLRTYPRLTRLIIAQNLCGLAGLAVSFYAVYAYQELGLPVSASGRFITAGILGAVGCSFLWAYLHDRKGSTRVLRGVSLLLFLVPASALALPPLAHAAGLTSALPYLYAVVFFLSGATGGGWWMGFTNYTMEISPEEKRPLFLGLQAFLSGPTVIWPTVGGVLLKVMPYQALFAIVMATSVISALYVRRLPEPRRETT